MNFNEKNIKKLQKVKEVSSKIIYNTLEIMENNAQKCSRDSQRFGDDIRENYACMAASIEALKEKFAAVNSDSLPMEDIDNISYVSARNCRVALVLEYMNTTGATELGLNLASQIFINSPVVKNEEDDFLFMKRRLESYVQFIETGKPITNWLGKPERDIMGNIMMEWREMSTLDREFIYKLMTDGENTISIDHPLYNKYKDVIMKKFDYVSIMGNPNNYSRYTESNVLTGKYTEQIARMEFGILAGELGINVDNL